MGFQSYEEARAAHSWEVPERYNIAQDVCDKHPPERLAMAWERFDGARRELTWGELQALANQAAFVLRSAGVARGDRVAVVLPPTPETAAVFFGVWKLGAILLSMSVLYGDEGVAHRLNDSTPKVLVTSAEHRDRVGALAEKAPSVERVVVVGGHGEESFEELTRTASDQFQTPATDPDTPAQLYYSSGTTGQAKGILHAHRYALAQASCSTPPASGPGSPGSCQASSAPGGSAWRRWCTAARAASTPARPCACSPTMGLATCSPPRRPSGP
jgi:acetyl-CoA synthetase